MGSEFSDIMDALQLRHPKIEKRFGPFTYSRDEFRFWHNLAIGKWEFSVLPDRASPCFHVSHLVSHGVNFRLEADYTLPAWADRALNKLEGIDD